MDFLLQIIQVVLYGMLVFLVLANLLYLALIPIERFLRRNSEVSNQGRSFVLFEPILIPPFVFIAWIRHGNGDFTSVEKAAAFTVGTTLLSWVPVWGTMFLALMISRKKS